MIVVGKSDIGQKRSANEDAFCVGEVDENVAWMVVCDGMGGANGGQVASKTVTDMVSQKIQQCYKPIMQTSSLENIMLSAVTTSNVIVYERSLDDASLSGMGTTIVSAIIKQNVASIAHVGDSRAYIIRGNSEIEQITKDHSLVQEMLESGQITKEQFDNHPVKNIITRAVGVDEKIEIDFDTVKMQKGDALLICTDGLSGYLSDEELLKVYNETEFDDLVDRYIGIANEKGGKDNITVAVLKCESECD